MLATSLLLKWKKKKKKIAAAEQEVNSLNQKYTSIITWKKCCYTE